MADKHTKSLIDDNQLRESQDGNKDLYRQWSNSETKLLIQLYKENKPKVRNLRMRTARHLWEFISSEMRAKYNINVTAKHVENKWRILERLYKKITSNNNKTGRSRKIFEYENEFHEILKNKRSCFPTVLLSSTEIIKNPKLESTSTQNEFLHETHTFGEQRPSETLVQKNGTPETDNENLNRSTTSKEISSSTSTSTSTTNTSEIKKKIRMRKNINNAEELREEFKSYHNKKIELEKAKIEQRTLYYKNVLEEKRKMRLAIEKRNQLLEKIIEKNLIVKL